MVEFAEMKGIRVRKAALLNRCAMHRNELEATAQHVASGYRFASILVRLIRRQRRSDLPGVVELLLGLLK